MIDRQVRRRIGFGALFLLLPRWIVEIRAGAECLALRRKHGGADFDIAIELLQRIRDLVDQGNVEEIERRTPDLDQADVIVLFDADVSVVAHWESLGTVWLRRCELRPPQQLALVS